MPIFWWVHKWQNVKFITRELTSIFVAAYVVILLFHLHALRHGPEAYSIFLAWLKTPFSIVLHGFAFLFVMFHSLTWFNLAPKAMVIRLGEKRIPGFLIAALNYGAWIVLSVAILWVVSKA